MSYIPEPEPTPLRLRLGPRAESFVWQPPADEVALITDPLPADADEDLGADATAEAVTPILADVTAPATESAPPAPKWNEKLDLAVAHTDERVERWLAEQQSRLVAGLDLMKAQLKERRQAETARLEAWKITEQQRVQHDLAQEEERFHERLMAELRAFEEQLALRLTEQEERLAKWWDEAEKLASRHFAEFGASGDEIPPTN